MLIAYILDKRDELNFPVVNFPFIFSNIPAAPVYEYISLSMVTIFQILGFLSGFP
jgi:hypothetical protein